jgi:predicted dehydrogenase
MTEIIRIAGTEGSIWIDGMQVRFADRSGEREVPIPPELQLSAGALGDDPRNERLDWQLMAEVEIAPYTELCRSIRSAISGSEPVSPVAMATFEDGVANMEVMDAIRASAAEGGQVVTVG